MILTIRKNRDMKRLSPLKSILKKLYICVGLLLIVLLFSSCAHIDPEKPEKVAIKIEKIRPKPELTSYTEALIELGMMSEIYATDSLKIQSIPISDNSESSVSTGGEIPKDISEMVKSVLNSIGGKLVYIPYDPTFLQNQMVTGYSTFQNKLIPDVVISGGITEFDQGRESREKSTDIDSRQTHEGLPGQDGKAPYPSKEMEFKTGGGDKADLARITLDFNLLNFQTMSGIPRMNTVNSIEVHQAANQRELGISIFAQAFGRKGKNKIVQGRHAAIRALVELSMIQIIGRQLVLPYWNLLGDDALPDRVVLDSAYSFYQSLSENQKMACTQQQLFLHGYDIPVDGVLDGKTISALEDFFQTDFSPEPPDVDHFMKLWASLPITRDTIRKRRLLNDMVQEQEEQAIFEQELPEPAVQEQELQEQAARERRQQQEQAAREKQQQKEQAAREWQQQKERAARRKQQQNNSPTDSESQQNGLGPEQPESKSTPEETATQETETQGAVNQLVRMLEQRKSHRKTAESVPKEAIDQLFKILEDKKQS